MKNRNRLYIIMLFFLSVFSCVEKEQTELVKPKEQIEILITSEETVKPEFNTFGTVVFFNKADIYPTAEGHIEKLYAEEGMYVSRNDILAELRQQKLLISREEAEAAVQSKRALLKLAEEKLYQGIKGIEAKLIAIRNAEAELEQKKNEFLNISNTFENKQRLYDAGGVTKEELDAVQTQYLSYETKLLQAEGDLEIQRLGFRDEDIISAGFEIPETEEARFDLMVQLNTKMLEAERDVAEAELYSALSNLKTIELLIEETVIRSPISGNIGSRYLDIGEKATPETKLFTVFNTEKVYIQIDVSEKDLVRIKTGQTAYITPDTYESDIIIQGTVTLISPFINPETRTCSIKIEADNSEKLLIPGQFVNVKIITGEPEKRIALPEDSVLTDDAGSEYVLLVKDEKLFKQDIQSDYISESKIVIGYGLDVGDIICKAPLSIYPEGMEVEVIR
jgi:RND family efflux transporter MFP subunit